MLRDEIKQIVHASVLQALGHLGFTVDDPHAIQKDMIHLRSSRQAQEEMAKWIKRTTVGICLTGLLYMLWDALGAALKR
jgi:hypothetical protein